MTDSAKQKILKTIETHGYGWSFCARDFMSELKRNDIDTALFHLMREGKIRKVMRGIYDYPMFSKMLNRLVASDLAQVAAAIVRNLQRDMQPAGNSTLNSLNLSTQLTAQYTYLWTGCSRNLKVGTQTICFRSAAKQDFSPRLLQSRLLVLSLRMLDSTLMDDNIKASLKKYFDQKLWLRFRADIVGVSDRIFHQICEFAK